MQAYMLVADLGIYGSVSEGCGSRDHGSVCLEYRQWNEQILGFRLSLRVVIGYSEAVVSYRWDYRHQRDTVLEIQQDRLLSLLRMRS